MTDFKVDPTAKYARSHEWVRMENGLAVVGISDFAQDELSDIVFIELPKVGAVVEAGTEVAVVESVKAAEDIVAPVSGTIVETNAGVEATPEIVNTAPYVSWLFKIQPTDALDNELAALMTPDEYDRSISQSVG